MKKELLTVGVGLMATALFADTATFDSTNALGAVGIGLSDGTGGKYMVAVPFAGASGGATSVSNVVACSNLAVGDKLYRANSSGQYDCWVVTSGTNGKYWKPTTAVEKTGVKSAPTADTAKVARGDGFWLETDVGTAYVLGEKAEGDVSVSVAVGWNLVGLSSASSGKKLSDITEATQGDMIMLADSTRYCCAGGGKWVNPISSVVVSDTVLPVGKGFWYVAKTAKSITL